MGLIDDKRNVFTTIGSYNSMNESDNAPKPKDSVPSINNKKDIIPFLLDVLKVLVGTVVLKEAIGGILGSVIDESEPKLKETLVNQLDQPESDVDIGDTSFGSNPNGIEIPVDDIDTDGKLSIDKGSDVGNLLYDDSKPNFDSAARDAIVNDGTDVEFNNITIKYDSSTEKFNIKPIIAVGGGITLGLFIRNFIKNTELINKDELVANTLDEIFGSVTSETNVTVDKVRKKLEITKILENLVAGDESMELNQNDLDDIFRRANEKVNGVVYLDMGCGLMESSLPFSGVTELINNISNLTNDSEIGNAISNTIKDNIDNEDNKDTIEDGFLQKIVNTMVVKMVEKVTTAPQVRMLMGVAGSVTNGGESAIGDAREDLKKFKTCIICLKKMIIGLIAAFLFALAIKYLVKILKTTTKKIIKEKTNNFTSQLKSLSPI